MTTSDLVLTGLIACAFALVHVLGGRMRFLQRLPRSAWLSFAGGVSVAYVFVHLLPELAARQREFTRAADHGPLAPIESHLYVVALAGLAVFYGTDRLVRRSVRARAADGGVQSAPGVFWAHLATFAAYNLLIGYLLVERVDIGAGGLAAYAVAMALHFFVNDHGLRARHGDTYHRSGRWLLAAAPILGWVVGTITALSPLALGPLFALLAGGIVLNVLKEELPEERDSRFFAFAGGAAVYSALLLATR